MKSIIVLPTYNERDNIDELLRRIFAAAPDISVLIVDDSSPDGTGERVRELMRAYSHLRLITRTAKDGLGKAYIHGFAAVLKEDFDTIMMMDGDLSHDPAMIPKLLAQRARYDLVVGSRYIPGGTTEGWELWRRLLSRWGNRYARAILRVPFRDCTTGYNAVCARLLRSLTLATINTAGYAFIMHLKYLLWKAGATVTEIPIRYQNRTAGKSKISNHIIAEGLLAPWKMLLKQVRTNHRRGTRMQDTVSDARRA